MIRRLIMAAVVSAAAVAATMIYTKQNEKDKEDNKKIEDDADEIRFFDLDQETEEKAEEPEKPEESDSVKEIAQLYPYLNTRFIAEQFVRNEAFNEQYPEDTLITIIHKVRFDDIELLTQFVNIAEENGYTAAALNESEFTVSKKMFTENGSILSDIYNIANQTACLKGTYEGYSIEV